MARLRMAVIGVGHLGKEHARILSGFPEVELVGVADANMNQAQAIAHKHGTQAFADSWPLLNLVDAATIAVPTVYHHRVATDFLKRDIPLLVEKPLASTLAEAESLADLARQQETILQVGHIERFNPAFEELTRRPLQPKFIQSERCSTFTGRSTDIGVVLDVMIHDLDIILALVQAPVRNVEAIGVTLFGGHEDIVNARLTFANGCVANVTASRASAAAIRHMAVWAPEGYASLDFAKRSVSLIQPSEELRRHGDVLMKDPAVMAVIKDQLFTRHLPGVQVDCNQPHQPDQLTRELQDFVRCVRTGAKPRVDGEAGRAAMILANQILDSVKRHQWEGRADGPTGPHHLPTPLAPLFQPSSDKAVA